MAALVSVVGLALSSSAPAFAADVFPNFDIASLVSPGGSSLLQSKIVFQNSGVLDDPSDQDTIEGPFDHAPSLDASDLTTFDGMVNHHVRWHYDDAWSSSFGSDFPRIRTPGYVVGDGGAPGVTQRIWFQFTLSRSIDW